jgi:hypothetical protein
MASESNKSPDVIDGEVVVPIDNTPVVDLNKAMEIRIEDADENTTVTPPPITVTNTSVDSLSAHQVQSPAPDHSMQAQTQGHATGILPKERMNKDSNGKAAAPTLTPATVSVPRLDDDESNEQDAFLNRRSVNKRKKPHTKLKESQMIIEVQEENVPRKHRYIGRHEPLPEDYTESRCGRYNCSENSFTFYTTLYLIRSFSTLVFHSIMLVVLLLSIGSTVIFYQFDLVSDMPLTIIATGLFFPISFGINWTFTRRESFINNIADLKSCVLGMYMCVKEWKRRDSDIDIRMKAVCAAMLQSIQLYLMHKGSSVAEVYALFQKAFEILEELRTHDDWIKSVISRAYQYHRFIVMDFEKLRVVHDYRTPSSLRAFGLFFLLCCPVLFGPLFAKYGRDYGLWSGIYISMLISIMLVSLYRIQSDQEDPCDGSGVDDLDLGILAEPQDFMTLKAHKRAKVLLINNHKPRNN